MKQIITTINDQLVDDGVSLAKQMTANNSDGLIIKFEMIHKDQFVI